MISSVLCFLCGVLASQTRQQALTLKAFQHMDADIGMDRTYEFEKK